jgi:hypothetical protein
MAWDHLKGLIFILIILWVVWFFTGGAGSKDTDKPFLKPLSPVGTGEKYGPK